MIETLQDEDDVLHNFALLLLSQKINSTFETRKNMFNLTSKTVLEILKFESFRILNFLTFHWLTWEVKTSLPMKFREFMSYYKGKFLSKSSTKNAAWKLVLTYFVFIKN